MFWVKLLAGVAATVVVAAASITGYGMYLNAVNAHNEKSCEELYFADRRQFENCIIREMLRERGAKRITA